MDKDKIINWITNALMIIFALLVAAIVFTTPVVLYNAAREKAERDNNQEVSFNRYGNFTSIDSVLAYDNVTKIVYRKNMTDAGWTVYIPYYAPNGLPYRYNSETNAFEEIEKEFVDGE